VWSSPARSSAYQATAHYELIWPSGGKIELFVLPLVVLAAEMKFLPHLRCPRNEGPIAAALLPGARELAYPDKGKKNDRDTCGNHGPGNCAYGGAVGNDADYDSGPGYEQPQGVVSPDGCIGASGSRPPVKMKIPAAFISATSSLTALARSRSSSIV
jgi:hypothetical protein